MSKLEFHKMEGAGNDFVVIDNRVRGFSMDEIISITPKLCDRRFGVGADGLLVLESTTDSDLDYTMIYRNADGSDAGMCGNGSRCLALFAANHGFESRQSFNVHDAVYSAEVDKIENRVSVLFPDVELPEWIVVDGKKLLQIYTGTEHVVSFEDSSKLENEPLLVGEGQSVRMNPALNPPGTNVNFVCKTGSHSIDLQTYERGVENLTLACGTGAMASAIGTHFDDGMASGEFEYTVKVKGGILSVTFEFNAEENIYHNLKLIGPAHFVFEGSIDI